VYKGGGIYFSTPHCGKISVNVQKDSKENLTLRMDPCTQFPLGRGDVFLALDMTVTQ